VTPASVNATAGLHNGLTTSVEGRNSGTRAAMTAEDGTHPKPISAQKSAVLVFAADDGYSLPLAVAMFSAARNYRGPKPLRIFVLDAGISARNRQKIGDLLSPLETSIEWVPIDLAVASQLPVHDHITTTTYARLLVPQHLPPTIDKAIYVDCDVLIEGDVHNLWSEPIDDNYLLGVQGHGTKRLIATSPLARIAEVTAGPDAPYFNAGVLVMNLRLMRRDRVADRAFEFCRRWQKAIRNADQDILNAVSVGKWRQIDPVWNQYLAQGGGKYVFRYQPDGILHFTSSSKPWSPRSIRYPQTEAVAFAFRRYREYMWQAKWFARGSALMQRAEYFSWRAARLARSLARFMVRKLMPARGRAGSATSVDQHGPHGNR
jgi:lipopolysaccharide biosynthesis glycosyltransferase